MVIATHLASYAPHFSRSARVRTARMQPTYDTISADMPASFFRTAKLGPSWTDLAFQLGYIGAYRVMRTYWQLRRPTTHGALVTLWCQGEVLLVRHSYVPYYSAPGGYVRRGEEPKRAAQRELMEELSLYVEPEALTLTLDLTHAWEGKNDHVAIYRTELSERPTLRLDYREVVEAFWFLPEQVRELDVFPPLKQAIAQQHAASLQESARKRA